MSEYKLSFLLKFGKEEHINQFAGESLYCSSAITFWGIEKALKIKGQGDVLEAGSRLFAQKMAMQDHDSNAVTTINMRSNVLVHYEPAERIPVFCLFAVYEDDCQMDIDGNLTITFSDETRRVIREHFPNADTVAIISNPEKFIEEVKESIGCHIEHGVVNYFNIDQGFDVNNGKQTAMDMEYIKYLTQDVPPTSENGKTTYSFHIDYVYRSLFCKDVFFKGEQEYRIVLPEETISVGMHYPIKLSEKMEILPLNKFLQQN